MAENREEVGPGQIRLANADAEIIVPEIVVGEIVVGEIVLQGGEDKLAEHLRQAICETLAGTLHKPVACAVEAVLKAHGKDAEFVEEVVGELVANFADFTQEEIETLTDAAVETTETFMHPHQAPPDEADLAQAAQEKAEQERIATAD